MTRELVQFVGIAEGSLAEVQTQLIIGDRLGYLRDADAADAHQLVIECQRMLNAMQTTLAERIRNGTARR